MPREYEERYALEIERIGCDTDHVHLMLGAHPKYSPGQLVRLFKSVTAQQLFKRLPKFREELRRGQFWSDGYYVAMVGERGDWSIVEKYIREQGMDTRKRCNCVSCESIPCALGAGSLILLLKINIKCPAEYESYF